MKYAQVSSEEFQLFRQRMLLMLAVVLLGITLLTARLWYLQLARGDYYGEVAQGNRIRVVPQEAPRGIIYDRTGKILAFNRPAFNIQVIPEDTPDLEASIRNLARVTGFSFEQMLAAAQASRSGYRFKPITLLSDVGRKTADLVETYQEDLPGISVAVEAKRLYPAAYLSSHVVGYVGEIDEDLLERLPLSKLRSGRIVGHAGVERVQNVQLIGTDGGRQVEVDHVGRELRVLSEPVDPVPGNDIYLTIDLRLQRFITNKMTGKTGAVIVMKPRTGEILAMASFPDYDPNLFVGGIQGKDWEELTQGASKPLFNKAIHGQYPPGSTFKMMMAMAGLDQGIIDENTTYFCPGYYRIKRKVWYCNNRGGHGNVNVVEAIQKSCNVFFYQLGMELGLDNIQDYAGRFGFGARTGVELDGEKAGLVPSREWKERVLGERWYDGETIPVAIGQGFLSVTPIQLLNYVNTIANRGLWVQPTLLRRIVAPDGDLVTSEADLPRNTHLLSLPANLFDVVQEGMVRVVNDQGTGRSARSRKVLIAGKTGSAQVVGRSISRSEEDDVDEKLLPHSLFAAFAPADNPQISVMVIVEHGVSGGRIAAPIAKSIIEYYFQEVEPLPPQYTADRQAGATFREQLRQAFASMPEESEAVRPQ